MTLVKPLTVKQRKYLKSYIQEGNYRKAGMKVGYYNSANSSAVSTYGILKKPNVLARMNDTFNEIGLTELQMARDLKALTRAKKEVPLIHRGKHTGTIEIRDNAHRLKALDQVAELRGMKVSKIASLNINLSGEDIRNMSPVELDKAIEECDRELKKIES